MNLILKLVVIASSIIGMNAQQPGGGFTGMTVGYTGVFVSEGDPFPVVAYIAPSASKAVLDGLMEGDVLLSYSTTDGVYESAGAGFEGDLYKPLF
jgi:hypothetical protein